MRNDDSKYKILMEDINKTANLVNKRIRKYFSEVKEFTKPIKDANPCFFEIVEDMVNYAEESNLPGKKLRPYFLKLGYEAVGGKDDNYLGIALTTELKHQFTLMHDDVMDRDRVRRSMPAVRLHHAFKILKETNRELYERLKKKRLDYIKESDISSDTWLYGDSQAIDSGDLNSEIPSLIFSKDIIDGKFDSHTVAKAQEELTKGLIKICFGQAIDVYASHSKKRLSEKDWYLIVNYKTVPLFMAAIRMGAILGQGSVSQLNCLTYYAIYTSESFQLKDDLIELYISGEKGKDISGDLKEGKWTFPVIKFYDFASQEKIKMFENKVFRNRKASKENVKDIIEEMKNYGVVSHCESVCEKLINKANRRLDEADPPLEKEPKEKLKLLSEFVGIGRRK